MFSLGLINRTRHRTQKPIGALMNKKEVEHSLNTCVES